MSDDLIGDCQVDLTNLIEDAVLTGKQNFMTEKYWNGHMKEELIKKGDQLASEIEFEDKEKFWLPVRRFVKTDTDEAFVASGSI